jgi:hypothetical protein
MRIVREADPREWDDLDAVSASLDQLKPVVPACPTPRRLDADPSPLVPRPSNLGMDNRAPSDNFVDVDLDYILAVLGADPPPLVTRRRVQDGDLSIGSVTEQSIGNAGTTTSRRRPTTVAHDGFFAVGRDTFINATALGINPATAFLVLARGSQRDNSSTSWSAQATSTRVGMRWSTAKAAITRLQSAGLVDLDDDSPLTRPRYSLAKEGDLIWLPNALVDGVGNEIAPVTKMRESQDPMLLRLLIELYGEQNLREDGGISPKVIWQAYDRELMADRRSFKVWQFTLRVRQAAWGTVTSPHRQDGEHPGGELWRRFTVLEQLGLIEWVPYLFEGPDGEPLHALHLGGNDLERELYRACTAAAERRLNDWQLERAESSNSPLVPVSAHMEQVTMIGIVRLRYRPDTRLTAAWWADFNARSQHYIEFYNRILTYGA